jgi:hypothetical protein
MFNLFEFIIILKHLYIVTILVHFVFWLNNRLRGQVLTSFDNNKTCAYQINTLHNHLFPFIILPRMLITFRQFDHLKELKG